MILQENHKQFAVICFTRFMSTSKTFNAFNEKFPDDLPRPQPKQKNQAVRNMNYKLNRTCKQHQRRTSDTLRTLQTAHIPMHELKSHNTEYPSRLITWVVLQCIYDQNNTYQDTKKRKLKTYRFKKMEFPQFCTKMTNKPKHRLDSQLRTKNVPKPYRNPKKRTVWYGFKCNKISNRTSLKSPIMI